MRKRFVTFKGYMAMSPPTGYVNGVPSYTDAGFIYVNAGCRGRDAGAPADVTDLKAAVCISVTVRMFFPVARGASSPSA